jgi:hypothetical protein
MGDIQDAQVLFEAFQEFLRRKPMEPQVARAFREHLLARKKCLIQTYLRAADRLLGFWPTPAAAPVKDKKAASLRRGIFRAAAAPLSTKPMNKSL